MTIVKGVDPVSDPKVILQTNIPGFPVRRGKVRRAKLYYLRGLRGKSARISEKQESRGGDSAEG